MAGRILKLLMYALSHPGQIFKCIYYKLRMERFGWSSIIEKPLKIDGINNICIGDKVIIQHRTWLASLPLTGERSSELVIKDGCIIGHYNHIYSTKSIIINKSVSSMNIDNYSEKNSIKFLAKYLYFFIYSSFIFFSFNLLIVSYLNSI